MLSISETVAWGALYYSFGVLIRPFAWHLTVSEATIAGAFSLALLATAGTASIAGRSIDRWGPRPVMAISGVLGVAALASLAAVDTVAGFYVAWAAIGVSHGGVLYEPAFTAIAKWFRSPSERARALLAVTTAAGFASTIFVPLTATLHEHFGRERSVLLLAAIVALTVVPLNASLPRQRESSSGGTEPGTCESRSTKTSPRLAVLALVFSLQAFASAAVTVHLVSHLCDAGLDLRAAAMISGLMGAAQVLGRLLFHLFRRLVGPRPRLPLLLGLQAIALVGILGGAHALVIPAVLLLGAANGLVTLERAAAIAETFAPQQYGAVNGRIATFSYASRALGPIIVGLTKTAASSYTVAFAMLVALTALSSVIMWVASSDARTTHDGLLKKA
jgi:cyanate permease